MPFAGLAAPALVALGLAATSVPKVMTVEPTAPVIPATTLRFYVVFDRPARGWVHQDDLRLLTGDGVPIPSPFMDFGQELWSPDGRRLTVLFDPGRVKRDVEGPGLSAAPLKADSRYEIVVANYRRSFSVGPPVREPLDPRSWRVISPHRKAAPVTVTFDRVMDGALVAHQLGVTTTDGKWVEGRSNLDPDGKTWRFKPKRHWANGSYRVVIGPILEDVSGNRVGEALDHDVGQAAAESVAFSLPFSIDP